jgi:Kef-type K+ transport system membrane component KefB
MTKEIQSHSQVPRGKILFTPFKPALRLIIQDFVVFFVLAIVIGLAGGSAEVSENVAAFNTKSFWVCIGLNALQIISSTIFFKNIRKWERWLVIFFTVVTIGHTFAMLKRLV